MASKNPSKLQNGNSTQSKEPKEPKEPSKPQKPTNIDARQEATSVLTELEAVAKKALKFSSTYAGFEKILDQKSALELQISDKQTELLTKEARITFLEAHYQQNIDDFEKRYADWDKERKALQKQITKAETEAAEKSRTAQTELEAKHKKEVMRLKKDLTSEKSKSESLAQKLDTSRGNEARLQSQLELTKTTLKEWEGKLALLTDIDVGKFMDQFQGIVQRYITVMKTIFQKDLPEKFLADRQRWENLPKTLGFPLSLPASNTTAAKNVRLTAALWTMSPLLSDYIFTPCRIHAGASDNQTIKTLLRRQLCIDKRRENMVRSLLLLSCPGDEIDHAKWGAVDFTIKEGQRLLGQMLEDPDNLRQGLRPVLDDFVDLWGDALVSKKFILASIEGDNTWEWGDMPEFDEEYPMPDVLLPTAEQPKFSTLNLFPRVFIPESDESIDPGILVWPDQNSIMASEAEYQKELYDRRNSYNGNGGGPVGPPPRRPRRHSTVDGGGSSRNGSVPSTPIIGKMPGNGHSFLGPGLHGSDTTNGSHGSGGSPRI